MRDAYPNFTQSLDALVKWLEPELDYWSVGSSGSQGGQYTGWARGKGEGKVCQMAISNTPALALYLAIEKVVDKEAK